MIGTVEYWYNDQGYESVRSSLYRAIGQYASRSRYIYLGLTQQRPGERFRQHQAKWEPGHEWHRMIVIYRARSFARMQYVEDDLIRYAQERIDRGHYACELLNGIDSQLPMAKPDPHGFWIYILVQA